jgi:hypothetical protein
MEALKATLATADPEKLGAVGANIDTYAMSFPEELRWAGSPQAPALLYRLFSTIDAACRPEHRPRPGQPHYLIDRTAYPEPDRFVTGEQSHAVREVNALIDLRALSDPSNGNSATLNAEHAGSLGASEA